MSLGTPYNVGSKAQASGVTTTVVTAGTDQNGNATTIPAAGEAVFVIIGIASGVATVSGVADSRSGSNVYTLSQKIIPGDAQSVYIYECLNPASHLQSGDTVTVTWGAATAATSNVRVIGCSGVAASSADDQVGSASASNAAPSATVSGTLAQASELAVAAVQSGSATGGVSGWGSGWTEVGSKLRSGTGSYMSVAVKATTSTAAPAASATLAVSGAWGELVETFKASTSGAGGLSIDQTSPLPAGQVGVAYTDQLTATGGITPYTWSITSGALPAGLTLSPGTSGVGGSGDITYVGVNTGPQGAPTLAAFNSNYSLIGPDGCYKFFFTALPASWSGTLMDQITTSKPGTFCYISWSTVMTASALSNFIATIPHSIPAVGFTFDSEPENGGYASGAAFVTGYNDQATKIHAAQASTPVQLVMMTSSYTDWYATGGSNAYIPPASSVDVYGMDFYDRKVHWAGNDMSTTVSWINWTNYVKNLGRPLALTEFGISGAGTDAAQNSRLQADWNYLKTAFGAGGSLSSSPLYLWLYWGTGLGGGAGTINDFIGAQTEATWKSIAATQSGSSSTGTGGGGLISGTPTTAAGSPFTPTIRVTDSAATTSSTAFSLTVTSSSALAITTATPLPGATVGTAYSSILTASGGTVPYTWSISAGSLPTGLSITGQSVTGTPTIAGAYSFTIRVTDNVSATTTLAVQLTVLGALTVATASLPTGQVAQAYSATFASAGGTAPYTWSLAAGSGPVPPGLTLDPAAGTLTGTPTIAGANQLILQVADAAGAIAVSGQLSLPVNPATGGAGDIGRRKFGGTSADWVGVFVGDAWQRSPNATVQFYNDLAAGTQYTGLLTTGGIAVDSVTADGNGEIGEFSGPTGVWRMAMDANGGAGPRRWIEANDMGDELTALHNAVTSGIFGPTIPDPGTTIEGLLLPSGDTTGATDTVAIQGALNAATQGTSVRLAGGVFYTNGEITVPPFTGLEGQHGNRTDTTQLSSVISAAAGFTGTAVLRFKDKEEGGYATDNDGIRVARLTISLAAAAGTVDGIRATGKVHGVVLDRVAVQNAPRRGISCETYTRADTTVQHPYSWNLWFCEMFTCAAEGYYFGNIQTDTTFLNCQALGCQLDGFYFVACQSSQVTSCRAEFCQNGFRITGSWGTGTGSGGLILNGCSTDRNTRNGILIDSTGNGGHQISGMHCRRDGRNAGTGGGGYAGLNVTSATNPVIVNGMVCYPGVDDDGTGTNSPQYGATFSGSTWVSVSNSYLHGNTAGWNDGGTNTTLRRSMNTGTASGSTSAPTRDTANPWNTAGTGTILTGDLDIATAGRGLQIAEGSNAKMGVTGAMTGGTITVSTTAVTANSRIFLTAQTTGGTAGALRVSARTAGTSFTITSSSGTDTSTVAWFIVEPG